MTMELVINGKKVTAPGECTILEAALGAGIYIPNLCWHPDLPPGEACRMCIVEVEGMKGYPTACTTQAAEGMEVKTETPELRSIRKDLIWLIMSRYKGRPESSSQLEKLVKYIGEQELSGSDSMDNPDLPTVDDEPLFVRDLNRCILCGRCVSICRDVRKTGVLGLSGRGIETSVSTSYGAPFADSACRFCEACVEVCPSGALTDKERFDEKDREKVLLPCVNTCPARIDAARYVKLIAAGRYDDALEVIREKVPFPEILGYVCDHPCEEECRRGQLNQPIAIRALKRFAAEQSSGRWRSKLTPGPDTGKKVAIVGSGPAGLTAAWFLRLAGHGVSVFESLPEPGGMMRTGIPAYRLPRKVLDREISEVERIGVRINTSSEIDDPRKLLSQGFDAVFLGVGASRGTGMGIPGEDSPGVLDGISFLSSVNSGGDPGIAGSVTVVGGGNVAIDAARCALRAGAEKAVILYRRTRQEMPALPEEVEEACREGVEFNFLVNPVSIEGSSVNLKVRCLRMELGEPDSSGRRRPVPVEGSEFVLKTGMLVMAIGQRTEVPEGFSGFLNERGRIEADPVTGATPAAEGIFAGGDACSGPASVIEAIAAGRRAAASMDRYLGGDGQQVDKKLLPEEEYDPCFGRQEGFAGLERVSLPVTGLRERLGGFDPVELPLDPDKARSEGLRCLKCQFRLRISGLPAPPSEPASD